MTERGVGVHLAVAGAIAEWDRSEDDPTRLLADLAESLDCQVGVLWAPLGERLESRAFWHDDSEDVDEFQMMTFTSRLAPGTELPGLAWQRVEPTFRTNTDGLASPRWRAAMAAGSRAAIAFPAIWADQPIAIIELVSREEPELTEQLKRSLTAIGYVIGLFLSHHRSILDGRVVTARQVEILTLAAQGLTGGEIAERLVLSPTTVNSHFDNIYDRLGVKHRAAAVAEAMRLGLVD
jgi:DNA-binding CsgD family transcriptional regulator